MVDAGQIRISPETLSLIAEIDELEENGGRSVQLRRTLSALRILLPDRDIERLLANCEVQSLANRCFGPVSGAYATMRIS